jgi:hypothetical protein
MNKIPLLIGYCKEFYYFGSWGLRWDWGTVFNQQVFNEMGK